MAKVKGLGAKVGRRRLGRGLESLISAPVEIEVPVEAPEPAPDSPPAAERAAPADPSAALAAAAENATSGSMATSTSRASAPDVAGDLETVRHLALSQVHPDPEQPRRHFDESALAALAESIKQAGVMQPIVVRPDAAGGYMIVAGERRWRAVASTDINTIPAIVRAIDDATAARWSLIENLQREDLYPIERADAFHRLAESFALTHQEIAEAVGLDRTSVTNHLRLRELDDASREALRTGLITMGHGRALLGVDMPERARLLRQVVGQGWSVRELERRIRQRDAAPKSAAPPSARSAHMRDLERRLGAHLGAQVAIRTGRRKGSGSVTIDFHSLDEFEGLCARLGFQSDA